MTNTRMAAAPPGPRLCPFALSPASSHSTCPLLGNHIKRPEVFCIWHSMGNLELNLVVVLIILHYKCLYLAVCSFGKGVPLSQPHISFICVFLEFLSCTTPNSCSLSLWMSEMSLVFNIWNVFLLPFNLSNFWVSYKVHLSITSSWDSSLMTIDNPCPPLPSSEEREGSDKPLSAAPEPTILTCVITWCSSDCILIGGLVWFLLNHELRSWKESSFCV